MAISWKNTAVLFVCFLSVSCHGPNPHLPSSWTRERVDPLTMAEDPELAEMHVFIIYASHMCSHTVLRIHHPDIGVVFWDPAGGYGTPEYPVKATRIRDLVIKPIPSVFDYFEFRQFLPTDSMEIFEFDLDPELAAEMIRVLRTGIAGGKGAYDTETDPFYCSSSISKFLSTHARDRFPIDRYFYPHDLAKRLYQLKPKRVLIYNDEGLFHYFPEDF